MKVPEKIYPVDYAGFWDFSEDGCYGDSVINSLDYPNAEQIANEIAKRYNDYAQLNEALKECKDTLQWHLNKSKPQNEADQSDFFNMTANAITQAEQLLEVENPLR